MGKQQLPFIKFLIYTRASRELSDKESACNAGDAVSIPEHTHTISPEHFLPLLPLVITTKLSFYKRLSH